MKYRYLSAFAYCMFLLIGCWRTTETLERYEQTVSSLLQLVNGTQRRQQMSAQEQDAWGRDLLVETNTSSIVYISQGADVKDPCDDIRLQLERDTGAYSISYTYDSHHYNSAGFIETENVGKTRSYDDDRRLEYDRLMQDPCERKKCGLK